jgi:Uma2 family endonuclease
MNAASPGCVSLEEYFALEVVSQAKHEWCDGVVYAMSRGTPEHARLCARVVGVLRAALGDRCETFSSDLMLYVDAARLSTYADASVVCGPLQSKRVTKNGKKLGEAVTNPEVVVEVLSDSTERYDRDGKFQAYKRVASLRKYVLVSQYDPCVEVYRRGDGDAWTCETAGAGGRVTIHGATIAVDDVYGPPSARAIESD